MKWALILTIALNTTNPLNAGALVETSQTLAQSTFGDIQLIKQEPPQDSEIVIEELVGPKGGILGKLLYESNNQGKVISDGFAAVYIAKNALVGEASATVTISTEPANTYPDLEYFRNTYSADKVVHLGPNVSLTLPLSVLDWKTESEKGLLSFWPSFYEGARQGVLERDIWFEVRLLRADSVEAFYTFPQEAEGNLNIMNHFLQANLLDSKPETLQISVQAVDLSRVLPNPDDLQNPNDGSNTQLESGNLSLFQLRDEGATSSLPYPNLINDLFHTDAAQAVSTCTP